MIFVESYLYILSQQSLQVWIQSRYDVFHQWEYLLQFAYSQSGRQLSSNRLPSRNMGFENLAGSPDRVFTGYNF